MSALLPLAVALALGAMIGLQRERAKPGAGRAGVRTYALMAVGGVLCGELSEGLGSGWIVAAGLLALVGLLGLASSRRGGEDASGTGITSDVAGAVTFLVGAVAALGALPLAVVSGGVVALLLHFKGPLHGLARGLSDDEVRGLMRIVLIGSVILPALPDQTYGPYDVLNPFRIWLVVVLIVGISVVSYALGRWLDARSTTLLAGVLGGFVSSTATTASASRRARADGDFAPAGAAIAMIASTAIFARIPLEVAAVAPAQVPGMAAPLGAMAAVNAALCALALRRVGAGSAQPPERGEPSQLRTALVFGVLYGGVLFAVAAAQSELGDAGLYGVAALSGLADIHAITISVAQLAEAGRVGSEVAWRAVLLAALANLVLKGALAFALGGRRMGWATVSLFAPSLLTGLALLALWP